MLEAGILVLVVAGAFVFLVRSYQQYKKAIRRGQSSESEVRQQLYPTDRKDKQVERR